MGKWTKSDNPRVEELIDSHIKLIVERILISFKPASIIVSGSFGNGEGSVLLIKDNKLLYLSDYEVIVVQNRPILNKRLKRLSIDLSKEIGADVGLYHNFTFKYTQPHLSRLFYRKDFLQLGIYDRRYSYRVIYGADITEKLPELDPNNIPVWEGIRLILSRIAQGMEHLSYNDIFSKPIDKRYWLYRIILACSDALLIYCKNYHHSYRKRCEIFQKIFLEKFPQLHKNNPNFAKLVLESTEYKLNPSIQGNIDIRTLWFNVQKICDEVFRFLIEKELGIRYNSYTEFQKKYVSHPKVWKEFYRYISAGFQNIMNLIVLIKINGIRTLFQKNIFRNCYHQELYSLIPVFYFSTLSIDGDVNRQNMDFVRSKTVEFFSYMQEQKVDDIEYYDNIRLTLVKFWRKLFK